MLPDLIISTLAKFGKIKSGKIRTAKVYIVVSSKCPRNSRGLSSPVYRCWFALRDDSGGACIKKIIGNSINVMTNGFTCFRAFKC